MTFFLIRTEEAFIDELQLPQGHLKTLTSSIYAIWIDNGTECGGATFTKKDMGYDWQILETVSQVIRIQYSGNGPGTWSGRSTLSIEPMALCKYFHDHLLAQI
jgi:hypothetical protein